ncbi:MAG: DUF7305 domain-containing protein [Planctomycetota bacterium]|jgi:hypothetical protein
MFVLVSMVVLLGFAALTIDAGYLYNIKANAQDSADAGALAGASALTDQAYEEITSRATARMDQNRWPRGVDQNLEVELGKWDAANQVFTPWDDPNEAFAVRVIDRRATVPLFFARVFGQGTSSVAAEAISIGSKPCRGIWGLSSVSVPGSVVIDSYDSNDGPYSLANSGSNGDVCSGGDLTVGGDATISGDVMPGYGHLVDINGSSTDITGTTTVAHNATPAVTVSLDEIRLENDNDLIGLTDSGRSPFQSGYHLRLASDENVTIPAGDYLLDSIAMMAGSTISLTGDTTIYVEGDIEVHGGGIVNTTTDPTMLTVYSTATTIRMSGSAAFYGALIAPYATATLGGTNEFYGMIIVNDLAIEGNFEFHVDETLAAEFDFFEPSPPVLVK